MDAQTIIKKKFEWPTLHRGYYQKVRNVKCDEFNLSLPSLIPIDDDANDNDNDDDDANGSDDDDANGSDNDQKFIDRINKIITLYEQMKMHHYAL